MITGFITAVRTLSIIPMPGRDADDFSKAIIWFPFVGFLLAAVVFLFMKVCEDLSGWHQLTAVCAVFLGALLTRGIHLDGLADFADGFGGGYTKEKILAIMKDSNIGTFGAVSLIFILTFKWVAIGSMVKSHTFFLIFPAYISSRFIMSYLASTMPYARDNKGTAALFVKNAGFKDALTAFFAALVLNVLTAEIVGAAMLFIALLVSLFLRIFYMKKVGGVTGDLLGAASEITETVLLVCGVFLDAYLKRGGL